MKKILMFFPHNFTELNSGVKTRIYNLCKYFKLRGFTIDQFALLNFESNWDTTHLDHSIIRNYYFYDWLNIQRKIETKKKNFFFITKSNQGKTIPDLTDKHMIKQFEEIVSKNQYDHIIISYLYWSKLIDYNAYKKNDKIILIEDFLSLQEISNGSPKCFGDMVTDEIEKIRRFDKAIYVSDFEYGFFSQFTYNTKNYLIPPSIPDTFITQKLEPKYDITFIAHDNVHNINGLNWFFKEILPLLKNKYRILVIGKVTEKVKNPNPEIITYEGYREKLDEIYYNTRITICPLLTGTGLKIKIVESLLYGKPCVCTSKSITGMPSKYNNGCVIADTPQDFAYEIARLISDNNHYKTQSDYARNCYLNLFEESVVYQKLDKIFKVS